MVCQRPRRTTRRRATPSWPRGSAPSRQVVQSLSAPRWPSWGISQNGKLQAVQLEERSPAPPLGEGRRLSTVQRYHRRLIGRTAGVTGHATTARAGDAAAATSARNAWTVTHDIPRERSTRASAGDWCRDEPPRAVVGAAIEGQGVAPRPRDLVGRPARLSRLHLGVAVAGRRDAAVWASIAFVSAEGGALVIGGGDCPVGRLQADWGDPVPFFELVLPPRGQRRRSQRSRSRPSSVSP